MKRTIASFQNLPECIGVDRDGTQVYVNIASIHTHQVLTSRLIGRRKSGVALRAKRSRHELEDLLEGFDTVVGASVVLKPALSAAG